MKLRLAVLSLLSLVGGSDGQTTLTPSFSLQTGGAILKIGGVTVTQANVYCRFVGGNLLADTVVKGWKVDDSNIECETPLATKAGSASVGYAGTDGSSAPAASAFTNIDQTVFYEAGLQVGVIRSDSLSTALEPGDTLNLQWNSADLVTTATNNLGVSQADLIVDVVLQGINPATLAAEDISSTTVSTTSSTTSVTVSSSDVANFFSDIGPSGEAAMVKVKVVASIASGRVGAVKASPSYGVLREKVLARKLRTKDGRDLQGSALCDAVLKPGSLCNFGSLACPTSQLLAAGDLRFEPDARCEFNHGLDTCSFTTNLGARRTQCGCQHWNAGAAGCYRQVVPEGSQNMGGLQCCYSASGGLLTDPLEGGGTNDCAADDHIVCHLFEDLLSFEACCVLSDNCAIYYENRPTDDGVSFTPPTPPAQVFGDPHFATIDQTAYTFNGFGEFVAFCGIPGTGSLSTSALRTACDPALTRLTDAGTFEALSVHYRFKEVAGSGGFTGTFTQSVGVRDPLHSNGQKAVTLVVDTTERIKVYNGAESVSFPTALTGDTEVSVTFSSGLKVTRFEPFSMDPAVAVTFKVVTPSGLEMLLSEVLGVIQPTIQVLEDFKNSRAVGLLGLVDGDATNDFLPSDSDTPLNSGATPAQIFNDFGQTWMIRTNDASLWKPFESNPNLSFANCFDDTYTPSFTTPTPPAGAEDACAAATNSTSGAAYENCLFDTAITQDVAFAEVAGVAAVQAEETTGAITNTAPIITSNGGMLNETLPTDVGGGQVDFANIVATDADGDTLTWTVERNDGSLFLISEVSSSAGNLELAVTFIGTTTAGEKRARIAISDGLATILYRTIIVATSAPTPTAPTPTATIAPTPAPTLPYIPAPGSPTCNFVQRMQDGLSSFAGRFFGGEGGQ